MSTSSEKKIGELYEKLAALKEDQKGLESKANVWSEKRDSMHKQVKDFRAEATDLKKRRNTINEKVKELKNLRDRVKIKRREKIDEIYKLKDKIRTLTKKKGSQEMRNVLREIEKLEWKIQTTSIPVREEKLLINQVSKLETQLLVTRRIELLKKELMVFRREEEKLETKYEKYRGIILELAEQSQKDHEEMHKTLNRVHNLKVEADKAHQKYLRRKHQVHNLHQECGKLLDEIKSFERKLQKNFERKRAIDQLELHKDLEERALAKLKCAKRLTWEEFKILAEKGLI